MRLAVLTGILAIGLLGGIDAHADADQSYLPVSGEQGANYYTKIKATKHNYGVYQSGGWRTSADNVQPIAHSGDYSRKQVHVTKQEPFSSRLGLNLHTRSSLAGCTKMPLTKVIAG